MSDFTVMTNAVEVAIFFARVLGGLQSVKAPLHRTVAIVREGIREGSLQGKTVGGKDFKAYRPAYSAWKSKHYPARKWLQLGGEGLARRSFTARVYRDRALLTFIGPKYMVYHQKGKGKMPKRRWFGTHTSSMPAVNKVWSTWLRMKLKGVISG